MDRELLVNKTPLIIIFLLSAGLCGVSFAKVSFDSWLDMSHERAIATVKEKNPTITDQIVEKKSDPKNYRIASAYKRSNSIWGVYDKVKDELVETNKPKKQLKTLRTNLGELILKDGQVVLISPIPYEGSTQIEVANLPYKKKGKNQYIIQMDKTTDIQKAALARLYSPLIDGLEGHEKAEINTMSCLKKKSRFSCELDVKIQ